MRTDTTSTLIVDAHSGANPSPSSRNPRVSLTAVCCLLVWLVVSIAGILALTAYSNAPGQSVPLSPVWPRDSQLSREHNRSTLVMFLHPHCPCSRASLRQLARLLAETGSPPEVQFVVFCPSDKPDEWVQTDLWSSAAQLASGRMLIDRSGREAARFGATTSGQTLLYGPRGELLFSGGITAGRGHEGDNTGHQAVVRLLRGEQIDFVRSPVYGCAIRTERSAQQWVYDG